MRSAPIFSDSRKRSAGALRGEGPPSDTSRLSLRLSLSRGGLVLELDRPCALGPLRVTALEQRLAGLRFPLDLSGGVDRFRHRRGRLEVLALEARAFDLARFALPRLRGLGPSSPTDVVLVPLPDAVLFGVRWENAALAFEVVLASRGETLVFAAERARGLGLGAPPYVVAARALGAALAPVARLSGTFVEVPRAATELLRALLPEVGARVPEVSEWSFEALASEDGCLRLSGGCGLGAAATGRAVRALELQELVRDADTRAVAGDLDGARPGYLAVLERAPRHREIIERLAALDATVGGRAEAALATLVESTQAVEGGILGGELLLAVGDREGAALAFRNAALREPYGPLAAMVWTQVAALSEDRGSQLAALDQAVTRAPALSSARWARLAARAASADVRGALADAEHLEADARGSEARHEAVRRAAALFEAHGLVADAAALFERALRYVPDSVDALLGHARALAAQRKGPRALELLRRAVSLGERQGRNHDDAIIELARALAEVADDRPAAIARARSVDAGSAFVIEARFFEGKWRSELGDLAGAGVAFGRLRDAVERSAPLDDARAEAVAALLMQAAAIEERDRDDRLAAQRFVGLALRLRPRDAAIRSAFRRIARSVEAPVEPPPPVAATTFEVSTPDDEVLAEQLTDRLRANPNDRDVVLSLADVLERLGRLMDLLALLSARIEEGDAELRRELWPRRRRVLEALAALARNEGRPDEASLYESMAADAG